MRTGSTPKPAPPPQLPNEFVQRSAWKQAVMGAFSALALVLAARLILLVAVVGAIALTVLVERSPDPTRLAALGVYAVVIVLPLAWLASRR